MVVKNNLPIPKKYGSSPRDPVRCQAHRTTLLDREINIPPSLYGFKCRDNMFVGLSFKESIKDIKILAIKPSLGV